MRLMLRKKINLIDLCRKLFPFPAIPARKELAFCVKETMERLGYWV